MIKYDDSAVFAVDATYPTLREINLREVEVKGTKYAKKPCWNVDVVENSPEPVMEDVKCTISCDAPTNKDDTGTWHDVSKKFRCWDSSCSDPDSCTDKQHVKWSRMIILGESVILPVVH